jgi:hypothetical protein
VSIRGFRFLPMRLFLAVHIRCDMLSLCVYLPRVSATCLCRVSLQCRVPQRLLLAGCSALPRQLWAASL